jgi:hypothetical protein
MNGTKSSKYLVDIKIGAMVKKLALHKNVSWHSRFGAQTQLSLCLNINEPDASKKGELALLLIDSGNELRIRYLC